MTIASIKTKIIFINFIEWRRSFFFLNEYNWTWQLGCISIVSICTSNFYTHFFAHADSTNPESRSAVSEQYVTWVTVRSTAQWPESRFESRLFRLGGGAPIEWRDFIGGGGGGRINEFVEFIEYELLRFKLVTTPY